MQDNHKCNRTYRDTDIKHALLGLSALALLPLAGCDMSAEQGTDQVVTSADPAAVASDGEIVVADTATMLADIDLVDGPHLVFIDVAEADEEPAVGVYEFVATGHLGTADFKKLSKASPLELFLAATDEGTEIPERLLLANATMSDGLKQIDSVERGWLGDAVLGGTQTKGNCTDSEFMSVVNAKGYNDRGTPTFRLNKNPATSGYFDDYTNWFANEQITAVFQRYVVGSSDGSIWSNVDRYYTRVAVCALGVHATLNGSGGTVVHPGPDVIFSYRNSNNSPHNYSNVVYHDFSGTGVVSWHFFTGNNYDWKTRIYEAEDNDIFDIGHAVEDL